jgi:replicative DNA helicase
MALGANARGHGRGRDRQEPQKVTYEPAMIAGKVPAHDLDEEAAVLGAILLSRDALDRVIGILKPEHFYSNANGKIFEAAVELQKVGKPVDIVTVATYLRDRELLAQVGGASYLAQHADATPAVAHVEAYATEVYEKWRLRSLVAVCQKVSAEGYGKVPNVKEFITSAEDLLRRVTADQSAKGAPRKLGFGLLDGIKRDQARVAAGGSLVEIRTGLDKLDEKLAGLHRQDLTIIAARPGVGKTSLALLLALNVIAPDATEAQVAPPEADLCAAIFSLEMPLAQVQNRFVCMAGHLDVGARRKGTFTYDQWQQAFRAGLFLADKPIWVDDTAGTTPAMIRAKLRFIVSEWERTGPQNGRAKRLGVVVIDYLQLMRFPGFVGEAEIGEISKALKEIAKEFDVPVIALSQLNRQVETRDAKDKRPRLADLRGSGSIEQDADNIIALYRDGYYRPDSPAKDIAELIVLKQRNGALGKVLVRWTGSSTRFDNLRPGDAEPEDEDTDQ